MRGGASAESGGASGGGKDVGGGVEIDGDRGIVDVEPRARRAQGGEDVAQGTRRVSEVGEDARRAKNDRGARRAAVPRGVGGFRARARRPRHEPREAVA